MTRHHLVVGLFATALLPLVGVAAEPKLSPRERGRVKAEVARPDHFPTRIWAACDFEGRTPDYAWFGPAEKKLLPHYPGNTTALGVSERPYRDFSALMTGINPVPGPRMGKENYLYLRYFLKGGSEATFQHFSLTREDNNHIHVTGLTEGKWSELTLNFTRDARRNDGSDAPFAEGERMDDFKVFVGKPKDGKQYELLLDDVIFFAIDPARPADPEPFPNRVIFLAAFDTGPKEKYWPGEFEIVEKGLPADSWWRVARAVPRKDGKGKWVRLQIEPPRPVGERTKLRFRYYLTGASAMTAQIFDTTDQDNRHVRLTGLKQKEWATAHVDFTADGKRNDGTDTPFAAGHKVDDLFFFIEPDGKEDASLLFDEVVLYDGGKADSPVTKDSTLRVALGPEAKLVEPFGIDFDKAGNAYVVELSGGRLLKVDGKGHVSTIAGALRQKGDDGDGGPAEKARFNGTHNLAVAPSGDIYLADTWNRKVRKIDGKTGTISTVAGTGQRGYSGDGGPAAKATFGDIYCASLDPKGEKLYLADLDNRRIRVVDLASGVVSLVAGSGQKGVPKDGADAKTAPLVDPRAVAADARGNVYVLERSGHALRVVDSAGKIRTVVGASGTAGGSGDGGDARSATLNGPKHLCVDRDGNVIIADAENHLIRKYLPSTGKIVRVAGTGKRGTAGIGGPPERAELARPHGVTVHPDGTLYIVDSDNHRVLRIEK